MLKKLHNLLLNWKPIPLCWWFEKHGWKIPKYLIGAGSSPNVLQTGWIIGDDDNADPDGCSWDEVNTARTNQAKQENFMVRIQMTNNGGDQDVSQYQLYYNDADTTDGAVQVGAELRGDVHVDSVGGTPLDQAVVNDPEVISDQEPDFTWMDGEYDEVDASLAKFIFEADYFTDSQFCVQFTSLAYDEHSYFFFMMRANDVLDGYPASGAEVATAAAPVAELTQAGFRICTAPGDNADPDDTEDHTWANENTDVTDIAKKAPFFVRFAIAEEDVGNSGSEAYSFYYNTEDNAATATQITTTSNVVRTVNDPEDAIDNKAATDVALITVAKSRENGQYVDATDTTDALDLTKNYCMEIQVCVQFQSDAGNETDYYFYARRAGAVLDNYTEVPKVTTAVAPPGGPRGPFGHPLHGPFRGPIS